jgi:hypothetical protein
MDLQWKAWSAMIHRAEKGIADDLSNLDLVFADLPIEVYGELLLGVPDCYPRLQRLLPRMPSDEVQRSWAGDCGLPLLRKGTSFVKSALKYFPYASVRSKNLKALDYGCGWGRLLRLFSKYFPLGSLEGIDPWDQSIELCRASGIRHPLAVSDYLPITLPTTNRKFEFIYAFSVFTHLSHRSFAGCLAALRKCISPTGVLVITIRPAEYWLEVNRPELYAQHCEDGWVYVPHGFKIIDGDSVYGDTSISLERLKGFDEWQVADIEVSHTDPLQVFVALRPR